MDKLTAIKMIIEANGSFFLYTSENNGTVIHSTLTFQEVDLITEWLKQRVILQQQENNVQATNKIINGKA